MPVSAQYIRTRIKEIETRLGEQSVLKDKTKLQGPFLDRTRNQSFMSQAQSSRNLQEY